MIESATGPATATIRVMLVDDHEVVRKGLRALMEARGGVQVVAEAGGVEQAVLEASRTHPDVVVMDVRLGDGSGVEATREIRSRLPATRVIMLTSFADDEALFASIMAGASGYLLKQVRGPDIIDAVRAVATGGMLLDPAVVAAVSERLRHGKRLLMDEKLARLTPQEERIIELIAHGRTNREIAREMDLAEKTVKNYVSNLLMKLGVTRRSQAAAYLVRHTMPT
jgi:two-component system, NarL family, response regulator DevR